MSTASARYQQLALNPQKLAGQCGKLKCCLNFELDTYLDALKDFPPADSRLQTEKGTAFCQKVDIFKGLLWFTYKNDATNWHALHKDQVTEILELNKKGKKIDALEEYSVTLTVSEDPEKESFELAPVEDSLTRFDRPKRSKNRRKKGPRRPQEQQSKDREQRPPASKPKRS